MTNRKGFTLIELLIVVVIIGILAAIAIPKFANTKEKATLAGMKSDLRNLVTAQEGFFSDNNTYGATIGALQINGVGGTVAFVPTTGNAVVILTPTAAGWAATATNTSLKGAIQTCSLALGQGTAFPGTAPKGVNEGAPYCY